MEKYHFMIEVQANTEAEAQAKLNLLLELGAFFKEFDARKLTGSFILYILAHCAGRYRSQLNKSEKQ
jgi:hypothetical protein